MKRLAWTPTAILILVALACSNQQGGKTPAPASGQTATEASSNEPKTFTGEIMDSACAMMGGHESMMKEEGAKDAKECTLKCATSGANLVLYDAGSKTTYQLDDQSKPKDFAGQKVKVTGEYDSATKTISVKSIQAA